ncbi:hypothetical protein PI125_g1346 [Phytophthora idaei]|nr:hypothetical protein PI125_g1346 [Phytophthora idaei]
MSSGNGGNLATSLSIGYNPCDDFAPQCLPRGSGNHHAHRAELEGAELRLDPRVASHSDLLVLEQRIHSPNANSDVHLLVVDLDEIPGWVDSFESPSALQSLAADVERQVAQLQGQLDLLLHFQQYAPRPVAPPPAVDRPRLADLAPAFPRSHEQGPGTA